MKWTWMPGSNTEPSDPDEQLGERIKKATVRHIPFDAFAKSEDYPAVRKAIQSYLTKKNYPL